MGKTIFLIFFINFFIRPKTSLAQIILPNPTRAENFTELITTVTNYISGIVGGLAVIMFIWAGILYLTSRGDPGQLQKANKALLYAAIGTAIALSGAGLVQFIREILY